MLVSCVVCVKSQAADVRRGAPGPVRVCQCVVGRAARLVSTSLDAGVLLDAVVALLLLVDVEDRDRRPKLILGHQKLGRQNTAEKPERRRDV